MIPSLHIVTDDQLLQRPTFVPTALSVMESGRGRIALHLRGPGTPGRVLHALSAALKAPAEAAGTVLLVNDRVDLVLVLDLPGAHLGQRSIPPGNARAILGGNRLLGLSVHGTAEAEGVSDEEVDFLLVGTIFPSASHPGGEAGGPERLRAVGRLRDIPLLAIGGITPDRVGDVLGAGARGVAVLGGIWNAPDPAKACEEYLDALERGRRR